MHKSREDALTKIIGARALKAAHAAFYRAAYDLVETAKRYVDEEKRRVDFHICPKLIYETVISTYYDIARHKAFHFPDPVKNKSDAVKRAAYFAKWILKFRPITVIDHETVDDPPARNEALMLLNEHLALEWGLVCIAKEQGLVDLYFTKKVRMDMLYYFHFRELTTDGFLSIFQLVNDLACAGQPNPIIEFPVA